MEESCQLHEFLWAGVPIGVQRKMVYICTSIMLLRISLEKKKFMFSYCSFQSKQFLCDQGRQNKTWNHCLQNFNYQPVEKFLYKWIKDLPLYVKTYFQNNCNKKNTLWIYSGKWFHLMQITSGEWVHICIGILEELFILQLDADNQRSLIEIINMDHVPVFSLHYGKAKTLSIFKKLINFF